jgi:hypothetical protein
MEQTGKPQIPSLKDSQKPQVRINGLQAGLSFVDRLKQFKKKDLAFITAGLGVLFMAPVAEHFMMSPETGSSVMTPGWDMKKGSSFGDGSSPYENGVNGLAPGGVTGGGDVITPLNVRDPASLIMGPGGMQQPAATATTPPPPKTDNSDWKDAIANAGSSAAKKAVEKAGLPVPKPSLTNAGLRGLGAVSGGGGGSYTPGPINSNLAPNKAAESNSLQRVQAAPGFKGVGPRGSENASAGSMESLKKAAAGAIDSMNRRGSAASAAEQAASMGMGGGSSGGGAGAGGADGAADKSASGSQNKDSSSQGESLDFLRRKAEQDKALDLQWKLKEKNQMLWPNLREKMLEEMAMGPVKGLTARMAMMMKNFGSSVSGSESYRCSSPVNKTIPAGQVGKCGNTEEENKGYRYLADDEGTELWWNSSMGCGGASKFQNCTKGGDSGSGPASGGGKDSTELGPPGSMRGVGVGAKSGKSLAQMCAEFEKIPSDSNKPNSTVLFGQMKGLVAKVNGAAVNLGGDESRLLCGAKQFVPRDDNITRILGRLRDEMMDSTGHIDAALTLGKSATGTVSKEIPPITTAIEGFLDTYVAQKTLEAAAKTPEAAAEAKAAADAALRSAIAEAKKYEPVHAKADDWLKGNEKADGIDAELNKGAAPLQPIHEELSKAEKDYLPQAEALLKEAASDRAAVDGLLAKPELGEELTADKIQELKNWAADIDAQRAEVNDKSYAPQKTSAEQIRAARDAAAQVTKPKDGLVAASVDQAKDIVNQRQKALIQWTAEKISEGEISDAASGGAAKTSLDEESRKVVTAASTHAEDETPKAAVTGIRKALEGKAP